MNEKQCDQLIAYFNDWLSPKEKAEFEAHLQTCSKCQEELKEWETLTEDLPLLSEPVEPPKGMKKRILDNIVQADVQEDPLHEQQEKANKNESVQLPLDNKPKSEHVKHVDFFNAGKNEPIKKKSRKLPWTLAACLLLSLLGNGYLLSFKQQTNHEQISAPKIENQVALADEQSGAGSQGQAIVLSSGDQKYLVMQTDQLKPLTGKEVYTAWGIKGDKPTAIGTFKLNDSGKGTMNYQFKSKDENWDAIAVSREPDDTSTAPKGPIVMQSEL